MSSRSNSPRMTKLRRSCSMDFRSASMANVLDVAKALCLACKQKGKPRRRSLSLFQIKSYPTEDGCEPSRPDYSPRMTDPDSPGQTGPGPGSCPPAARSMSVNSVSSEGSATENSSSQQVVVVEQEDIIVLTHDVKSFKEALGKLRRIFHPERDKSETMRKAAHARLGEVLRILRSILEKYPPIQSTELLMTAGTLIHQVKGYNYEDDKSDPSDFFDAIDQLALAFSSRVSEYLMGDLDSSSQPVPKTRSCDNLLTAESEANIYDQDRRFVFPNLSPEEIDNRLAKLVDGVDLALRRAKVWSKYAKDVMAYIEKRCSLEAEYARNLVKLVQTMRPLLKEESFLPFQSIYCMALDQDSKDAQISLKTCSALQGCKFIEPLTARRNEHEKFRKQIKETWHRELKRMHEAVTNLRKAKSLYHQRQQDYEKAKDSALRAENSETSEASKVDKKRRVEDDACQRAMEAETTYKSCVVEANERQLSLEKIKSEVLKQVRELIYQCDQTMKAVTVGYFQLQYERCAPAPVQFQTLCEKSRLYEPGMQYMEFVKRLPQAPASGPNGTVPFSFEPYFSDGSRLDKARKSNGSTESSEDILGHSCLESRLSVDTKDKQRIPQPAKAWCSGVQVTGSDSDSMSSCPSNKSQDTSPAASPHIHARKVINVSSGEELETDHDNLDPFGQVQRTWTSKAAETHNFRKLKTPSRCRECDSYVYFQGFECLECGLTSHKRCLEELAIQCGRKRLPRKMNTFGVDLMTHALESGENIPCIVNKCIGEIEDKGFYMKGIYRVSGVKSKVEKLCQSFENGAELVDLDGFHPNIIANVLKLYLRQLPEPLLTFRLYPDFIKVAKDYPSQKDDDGQVPEGAVDELQKLVHRLPAVHLSTLACLMHHLYRVSQHSEHNHMPPSNLGIVFGPTLLRTSEGSASLSSLVDTVHQTRVIELLIMCAYKIFDPPCDVVSSHKNSSYFAKVQSKSARYHTTVSEKQALSRTISGASQTSDYEELQQLDSGCHQTLDTDDYSLPGYMGLDKSRDSEVSHHGSDVTHSSEDLLYSAVMSDDDFPEILLPDDSVLKKSPLLPRDSSEYLERKSGEENVKQTMQTLPKAHDNTRASLSSSPAVSEASHSSSLLRSTDDESCSGSDVFWKENLLPVPLPLRKNAPSSLPLNQSFLHGSSDKKQGASSVSESSGVSSAASTSPTGTGDTGQSDSSNVYTSTATVTLAGQKIVTSPGGCRTSTSTAELRRQFFETSPGVIESVSVPSKSSTVPLVDVAKGVKSDPQSSPTQTHHSGAVAQCEKDFQLPDSESKPYGTESQGDILAPPSSWSPTVSHSPDSKPGSSHRYVSPLGPTSYRLRGSSLTFNASPGTLSLMEDKPVSELDATFSPKSETFVRQQEEISTDTGYVRYSSKTVLTASKSLATEKNIRYTSFDDGQAHEQIEKISLRQNISLPPQHSPSLKEYEHLSSSMESQVTTSTSAESVGSSVQQDHSMRMSEKLSPNRQPRFV